MTKSSRSLACAAGIVLLVAVEGRAQASNPQNPTTEAIAQGQAAARAEAQRVLAAIVPLKIQVVLSKYQGEKKISSLPYELTVRTDGKNAPCMRSC